MVTVNTNKEGGEVLEPGNYEVRVEKVESKINQDNGNESIQVNMKVLEGPHEGHVVVDWLRFADNVLWKTLPILRGMGVDVPEDTTGWNFDEYSLVNTNFVATFGEDTYEGRTRNVLDMAKTSEKKFATAAITDDIPF